MFILSQNGNDIFNVDGMTDIRATTNAKGDVVVSIIHNGDFKTSAFMGRYQSLNEAQYVVGQIFEALCSEENYAMPHSADLPDLTIRRAGRGTYTNMHSNHGRS